MTSHLLRGDVRYAGLVVLSSHARVRAKLPGSQQVLQCSALCSVKKTHIQRTVERDGGMRLKRAMFNIKVQRWLSS